MPLATNPISVLLEAIFAIVNVALSVVLGYLGTIGLFAFTALLAAAALVGVAIVVRAVRR